MWLRLIDLGQSLSTLVSSLVLMQVVLSTLCYRCVCTMSNDWVTWGIDKYLVNYSVLSTQPASHLFPL